VKQVSRKAFYLTIEILALVGVLLTLGVLATLWRLNQAPLDVSFLNTQFIQSLKRSYPSLSIALRKSEVHWVVEESEARLLLSDLSLRDKTTGQEVLRLPNVDVSVALKPLAVGRIVPSQIVIDNAQLDLTRNERGTVALGFASGNESLILIDGSNGGSTLENTDVLRDASDLFFSRLHAQSDTDDPLSYLQQVQLTNATVNFSDLGLNQTFTALNSNLILRKVPIGLEGRLVGQFSLGNQIVKAGVTFVRSQTSKISNVNVEFQNLSLNALAQLDDRLRPLEGITSNLDGTVVTELDSSGKLNAGSYQIFMGEGAVKVSPFWEKSLPLKTLQAEGTFDIAEKQLLVSDSTIIVGRAGESDTLLKVSGFVIDEGPSRLLSYQLSADRMAVKELSTYWPSGIPSTTRSWVLERSKEGILTNIEFDNEIRLQKKKGSKVEKIREFISLDFDGLSLQLYRKLEPILQAKGRIQIIDGHIDVTAKDAVVENVLVTEATVVISPNQGQTKHLNSSMMLACEAKVCMSLLNKIGLKSPGFLRLKEQIQSGQVLSSVNFAMPLPKLNSGSEPPEKINMRDIDVAFAANVHNGVLLDAVGKENLEAATLEIEGDKREFRVKGQGQLAGAVNSFTAVFRTKQSDNPGSAVRAAGNFTAAGLERILPGLTRHINGPVGVEVSYQKAGGSEATVGFSADLTNASIVFSPLDYMKHPGQGATAAGLVHLSAGKPYAISEFSMRGPGLSTTGDIRIQSDGKNWEQMRLSSLEYAGNRFSDLTLSQTSDYVSIHAKQGVYDSAPLFGKLSSQSNQTQTTGGKATVITVEHLDRLGLPKGKSITNVSLSLRQRNGGIEEMNFTGYLPAMNGKRQVGTKGFIQARLAPNSRGEFQLDLTADDAGALLDTFGIWKSARYGKVRIKAVSAQPFPLAPIRVGTWISRFTILDTPTLTQLLSFASLTGMVDVLNGKGLFFGRMESRLTYHRGKIQMDDLRMKGPSLGIRLQGQIDNNAKRLALTGTIAPFNFVTQLVDGVPLLRDIVNGVKGEGILAANFRLDGRMQKPKISVNPLVSIAPGIVRDVFGDILGNDFVGL